MVIYNSPMDYSIERADEKQKKCLSIMEASEFEKSKRPAFHLASPCGWINDPNGFSFFNNKCHLFFQYHPYSNKWGPMHWGHAVTSDLLRWNFLEPALAPDSSFDRGGCFSGTAIEDGSFHIIAYTSVIEGNAIQNQSIAIGDGKKYVKKNSNPAITAKNVPFDYDKAHFRDPKLWKENETYFLGAVLKTDDGSGAFVIFKSRDLEKWDFVSVADRSLCKLGMMWECPDFFSLDGTDVIIISPQEMKEDLELGFHDGNNSVVMTGTMDRSSWKFSRNNVSQIDYGIDFYAPQTTLAPDGRRLMIAWMHRWEGFSTPDDYLWSGMMTLPRELKIENGVLFQSPAREIDALRKNGIAGDENLPPEKEIEIKGVKGRFFDLLLSFLVPQNCEWLEMKIAKGENCCSKFIFDFKNKRISFDRSESGTRKDCESFREFRFEIPEDRKINMRLICDISSAELFVCDGRYAFTNVFYSPIEADGITFAASHEFRLEYEFYQLK